MLFRTVASGAASTAGAGPDVWVVVGAIAAAAAAIAGFWVTVQRWRYLPRPHWVLLDIEAKPIPDSQNVIWHVDGEERTGELRWNVRTIFANHGDGAAHDVWLETLLPMGWRRPRGKSWARIEPGESIFIIWPALPEGEASDSRVKRFASGDGNVFVFDRKMRIRWRQRPRWRFVRKQTLNLNKEQNDVNLVDLADDADFPSLVPPAEPAATSPG